MPTKGAFRTPSPPFEFNNDYRDRFEKGTAYLRHVAGRPLVEAVEIPEDFFVGVQFHPEFKSRPNAAHPSSANFAAALRYNKNRTNVSRFSEKEQQ